MKTALLVIDVQMALAHEDAAGAERSCPGAEDNIALLLDGFRSIGGMVVHVHHHGTDPDDPFHPDSAGAAVQPVAAPQPGEPVVTKTGSSGFVGTPLQTILQEAGVERVILCGATANHCVESTTRNAADLGFNPVYAADAVWTYGLTGPDGVRHGAERIHSVSMATLDGELAVVKNTKDILSM
ncbi:isochorismatase family protein [Roseovarius spongiae]|uniref:Isochorismatase family protein n=1 Tax=Roseovarius spongiae TaxID=2320272 RepID=A0A3A8B636_9RHOB|nr:isochorismatase family protein [Roseovarius spongiae]RKF16225.1 isochorismatase family protein [Roseovarius spongiae]